MRKIVITQRINNFSRICGSTGVKWFLFIFWVDNINSASPDDNFLKFDFVSSFEPWYDGKFFDAEIGDMQNQSEPLLKLEALFIFFVTATDELASHYVFECYVWKLHYNFYGWFISSFIYNSHVYIMTGYHAVYLSNRIPTYIRMDDRTRVTRRPENTNNIFEKRHWQVSWHGGESKLVSWGGINDFESLREF